MSAPRLEDVLRNAFKKADASGYVHDMLAVADRIIAARGAGIELEFEEPPVELAPGVRVEVVGPSLFGMTEPIGLRSRIRGGEASGGWVLEDDDWYIFPSSSLQVIS